MIGLTVTRLPCRLALALGLVVSAPASSVPTGVAALRDAADAAGMFVGVAAEPSELPSRGELVGASFNSLTPENRMKWGQLTPGGPGVYDFAGADALVDFAQARGMRVRGHTLFWGRLNGPPAWLEGELAAAPDSAARLAELMEEHAAALVGRYAGRVAQWDVVNEPFNVEGTRLDPTSPFLRELGESYLDLAFHAANAADPSATLYLNEVLAEQVPQKLDNLLALVEGMLARGVPVHGVGLQGHWGLFGAPDRGHLEDTLRRVGQLGLEVELTEVDLPLVMFQGPDPLAEQAQAYADVFGACAAVAACKGVTVWGIDDAGTWLDSFFPFSQFAPNRPLLFDEQGTAKPAVDAIIGALRAPEPACAALVALALATLGRARAHGPRAAR